MTESIRGLQKGLAERVRSSWTWRMWVLGRKGSFWLDWTKWVMEERVRSGWIGEMGCNWQENKTYQVRIAHYKSCVTRSCPCFPFDSLVWYFAALSLVVDFRSSSLAFQRLCDFGQGPEKPYNTTTSSHPREEGGGSKSVS